MSFLFNKKTLTFCVNSIDLQVIFLFLFAYKIFLEPCFNELSQNMLMLEKLSNKSMEYDQRNNWSILGDSVGELIFKFPYCLKSVRFWLDLFYDSLH